MNKDVAGTFDTYFGKLDDPRIERHKLYPLPGVLFLALCDSICGEESVSSRYSRVTAPV